MRIVSVTAFVLLVLLVGVTRFWPIVERVEVLGAAHRTSGEIMRLADVAPGDPFLWVTSFRARALIRDPWVLQARITRHWPDTIAIAVRERVPVLSDGERAWAIDGILLPGLAIDAHAVLPRIEGWGTERLDEVLTLLGMLEGYGVEVITYTPEGFEILLSNAIVYTPTAEALQVQWSAFESQRGGRISVYPWGVSSAP
ncbi:MAG: FtsQ-type POTRA domain-containing protein [Trueperaceae bacterium]|nr:FtsQ-type POTRA domain-containing protein [Trueperaceae bacterium]